MTKRKRLLIAVAVAVVIIVVIVGIALWAALREKPVEGPAVTIRSPQDGDRVPLAGVTNVYSTARDGERLVTRLELWVDGELMETDAREQGAALLSVGQGWQPAAEGPHVIVVRAFNKEGGQGQASVRVEATSALEQEEGQELAEPGELPAAEDFVEDGTLPPAGDVTSPPGGIPSGGDTTAEGATPAGFFFPRPWGTRIDLTEAIEAPEPDLADWLANIPVNIVGSLTPGEGPVEAVEFEALSFSVTGDFDETYCYAALLDEPVERIPAEGSLGPLGARAWDIAEALGGENRILVRVSPPDPLRVFAECYGWAGGVLVPLGISERLHPPEEWDGRMIGATSSGGTGGDFSLEYRIIRVAGPDAPYGLELLGPPDSRSLRWEWDGDEGEIDGFRLYMNDNLVKTLAADMRIAQAEDSWFDLGCGGAASFSMTAYSGTYGGDEIESFRSTPVIFTTEACPTLIVDVLGVELLPSQPCVSVREVDIRYRLEGPEGFLGGIAAWLVAPDGTAFGGSSAAWVVPTGPEAEGVARIYLYYDGTGRVETTGLLVGMWREDLTYFHAEILDLPLVWDEDRPDLVVSNVEVDEATLTRRVLIANVGCGWASDDEATLAFSSIEGDALSGTLPFTIDLGVGMAYEWQEPLVSVPSGEEDTYAETWVEQWTNGFRVEVDPRDHVEEGNESNNEFEYVAFIFSEGGRRVWSSLAVAGEPDTDRDGLNDVWERAATQALNPYVEFDEEENLLDTPDHFVASFARITPYPALDPSSAPGALPQNVLFYDIVAFTRDYGRFMDVALFQAHNGDTEPLVMGWRVEDAHTLRLIKVFNAAHGGDTRQNNLWDPYREECNEAGITTEAGGRVGTSHYCSPLEFYQNRLFLWVSEGKHGLYPTCEACETITLLNAPIIEQIWNVLTGYWTAIGSGLAELFTLYEDDHLVDQVEVLGYEDLQPIFVDGERYDAPFHDRPVHLQMSSAYYILYYHVENEDFPHVRVVLDSLWCAGEDDDGGRGWGDYGPSNEPYLVIAALSLYPEGVTTWVPEPIPPIGDDVDSGEWDEDFPSIVIFDGEVGPGYVIGFGVSLYEDDGTDTGSGERRGMANEMASQLAERFRGEALPGVCGEDLMGRALPPIDIGEDCGNPGSVVNLLPIVNVGEPPDPVTLWVNDLSAYGFPGEYVMGLPDCDWGFCGCLSCEDCGKSIGYWMQLHEIPIESEDMPERFREFLQALW
ncbi:MAG: hypothetical protein A2Z66_12125 [Chloroflexi bacterium RBG_13_66_10]|nr:MAG: hypothetical protein A2Z66_12125 [Chloroflexi bacterium RBG_13_66_10]